MVVLPDSVYEALDNENLLEIKNLEINDEKSKTEIIDENILPLNLINPTLSTKEKSRYSAIGKAFMQGGYNTFSNLIKEATRDKEMNISNSIEKISENPKIDLKLPEEKQKTSGWLIWGPLIILAIGALGVYIWNSLKYVWNTLPEFFRLVFNNIETFLTFIYDNTLKYLVDKVIELFNWFKKVYDEIADFFGEDRAETAVPEINTSIKNEEENKLRDILKSNSDEMLKLTQNALKNNPYQEENITESTIENKKEITTSSSTTNKTSEVVMTVTADPSMIKLEDSMRKTINTISGTAQEIIKNPILNNFYNKDTKHGNIYQKQSSKFDVKSHPLLNFSQPTTQKLNIFENKSSKINNQQNNKKTSNTFPFVKKGDVKTEINQAFEHRRTITNTQKPNTIVIPQGKDSESIDLLQKQNTELTDTNTILKSLLQEIKNKAGKGNIFNIMQPNNTNIGQSNSPSPALGISSALFSTT